MILTLMIPIDAIEAAEKRICLIDFQLLGSGGGLLCGRSEAADRVVVDTVCEAFEPIRYSRTDTQETRRQIREHNAMWDALCKAMKLRRP